MNDWHAILVPFRWSGPLGRREYAARSAVAALAFGFCFLLMTASFTGLFFHGGSILLGLLLVLSLFVAATSCPFVLPLLVLEYFFFPFACYSIELPFADMSCWSALLLFPLSLLLTLICILRLMALAVRRRRDAGKYPPNVFAYSGLTLIMLPVICNISQSEVAGLLWLALLAALQCRMLFHPTRPQTPPTT